MDGFKTSLRARARWALTIACVSALIAHEASAQVLCDTGNPCARDDIASHSGIGPSTGANNPIDVVSGNKYQAEIDFQLPGELAVSFTRHYNSASVQGGAFGGGWSHTYETVLTRVQRSGIAAITIVQGDGRRITFRPLEGTSNVRRRYVSTPFGYGVIDEDIASIEALRNRRTSAAPRMRPWRWTWSDGRQLWFDELGALSRVQAASGEWLELEYDKRHRLSRVTDFAGRELRLAYWDEPSGWLRSFDETQLRGARHRLKSLRLPDGRTIQYGYDANGLLSEARFADGTRKRYEYAETSGALRLARIVARGKHVAGTYRYDTNGHATDSAVGDRAHVIHIDRTEPSSAHELGTSVLTNAAGGRTSYRWRQSAFGFQLVEATGPGCPACPVSNVRYVYDERGLVERVERLSAASSDVEWSEIITRDSIGRLIARHREQSGVRELIERYEYDRDDPLAKPARIVRPSVAPGELRTIELEYNARGQVSQLTDNGYAPVEGGLTYTPIRRSTSYAYYGAQDGAPHLIGRLKSVDGPLPGEVDRTVYRYDTRGLLSRIVYSNGASERFDYDTLGRLREYVPLDDVPIALEYDNEGRVSSYLRAGLQTKLIYDADGRIEKLRDPIGQQFSFEYDGSVLQALEDVGGNRIEFELDDEGRPIARRLLNPDGTIAQVRSARAATHADLAHERAPFSPDVLSFIRLPILKSWTTAAEMLIEPALAASAPLAHREVDDRRGLVSHYRHDDFGRLVHAFNPDAGLLTLEYDDASRIIARHFADGRTIRYAYDALGRIETISAGSEHVAIEYGPYNKPASIRYAWGVESFEYDQAGRLARRTQQIDSHEFTRTYDYDSLGRLSEATLPDGTTLIYRYNGSLHAKPGVLSSIDREGLFGSTPIVTGLNEADDGYARTTSRFGNGLEFERELDLHGRLRRFGTPGLAHFELETDAAGRIASVKHGRQRRFSYDAAGRLERAAFNGDADAASFGFDAAGNVRVTATHGMQALLRVDHATNRLLERTEATGRNVKYDYDAAGRTTRIGERELEYDAFGRMARILENGRAVAEYSYNVFGERIRKVVYAGSGRSVTYFFYDGSKLTAEADEQGEVTKQFVYIADRPVAMLAGAQTYAIHTDWLGTPLAATDQDRRVVWRAEIDPIGRVRSQRGQFRVDLRGSNQYFDNESGFHYNLNRYFDPSTSRYLTPDPIGQLGGLNLYAFANGDPINFVDPLGLQAIPPSWDDADRFRVLIKGTFDALPGELREAIGEALLELIEPATIATMVGVFAAWAVAQLTPFGWAADLLILGVGFAFMGAAIVDLAKGTLEAYRGMRNALTIQELCAAGEAFADVLATAAVELSGSFGFFGAARRGGAKLASQIRRIFRGTSRAPPPRPLLWTQEMAQRVTDSFGNQIRQFMAGRNHMWRTEAERGRWRVFEDAAESFVRAYFNPRYVINARHNNGTPNPDGNNGFDIVFVNQEGRLVIGEAKSGTVTPITAFGGGARGGAQLELNLEILRRNILADVNMPEAVKRDLIRQIETRTFETHLYITPTSSIPDRRLDVFQELLERPLDAIYILPEQLAARN